jgi:hypothetical protein
MDLVKRFTNVSCENIVRIGTLREGVRYPITHVQRMETKYGPSLLVTLRDCEAHDTIKVFLPKRYSLVFTDEDIAEINRSLPLHSLIYNGCHPGGRSLILNLEKMSLNPK